MADTTLRVYEDEKVAQVDIVRTGLDLSRTATVWCTTTMVSDSDHKSATPGVDYVPVSQKITLAPGQSRAVGYVYCIAVIVLLCCSL